MSSYRTFVSSVLLASSLGLLAVPVAAAPKNCGSAEAHEGRMEHRAERMAQRHKQLHGALKLTPEQEGPWTKLSESEHPTAKAESGKHEAGAKLTTPERADKMLERMKAHQMHMTAHVAAIKDFYAVLTPEQKKVFDDFHTSQHSRMHGKAKPHASGADKAAQKP